MEKPNKRLKRKGKLKIKNLETVDLLIKKKKGIEITTNNDFESVLSNGY